MPSLVLMQAEQSKGLTIVAVLHEGLLEDSTIRSSLAAGLSLPSIAGHGLEVFSSISH